MVNTGIYIFLLLGLFIVCISKRYSPLALCLVGYYLFIAIISYFAGTQGIVETSKTTIIPYIFLFLAYLLYFFPFFKRSNVITFEKLSYDALSKLKPFCFIYTVCSVICISCYMSPLKTLIQSGDWAMTRYMHYHEGNTTVYTNVIEQIGIAFTLYFFLLAVIVGMMMLKEEKDSKWGYILLTAAIVSNFMQALYAVGRGTIFNELLIVIVLYLFIIRGIDKNKIYFLLGLMTILLIIIIPYMVEISTSRFSTNSLSELLRYFGEAPVVFNVNVTTIDKLAWGKFLFSRVLNTGFSQSAIGGTWGFRFYTFAGFIYIDWGYIGLLLFGVIFGLYYFNRKICKSIYRISDLFLIFYYYNVLLTGGLVIGTSFFQDTFFAVLTYLFLKYVVERINLPRLRIRR